MNIVFSTTHKKLADRLVSALIDNNIKHSYFNRTYEDIEELRIEFEASAGGEPLNIGENDLKNWLAWFSIEETCRRLYGK